LSLFGSTGSNSYKGLADYKSFVESYEPDPQESKLLEKIVIESIEDYKSIGNNPEIKVEEPIEELVTVDPKPKNQNRKYFNLEFASRLTLLATFIFVFAFLFNYGYRNVQNSFAYSPTADTSSPSPTPTVAGSSDIPIVEQPAIEEPARTLEVKTGEDVVSVNIRSKSDITSEVIGTAKNGDTFEYVSFDSDWYGVKMKDGATGYIFAEYLQEIGGSNQ
jgi:hypothetical protein